MRPSRPSTDPPDIQQLLDLEDGAVRELVRARNPEAGEAALAAHPGLLAGHHDRALDDLIAAAEQQGAVAAASALRERRALLDALRDATSPALVEQLGRIALRADAAVSASEGPELDGAIAAWERFTQAPAFATVPADVRALALNRLGFAHSRCHDAGRSAHHEDEALDAFERAVATARSAGLAAVDYRCNALIIRLEQAERSENPPLDELLMLAEGIVEDASAEGPLRAAALVQLSETRELRFLKLGDPEELTAAETAATAALRCTSDDPKARDQNEERLRRIRRLQRSVGAGPAVTTVEDPDAELARLRRAVDRAAAPLDRADALARAASAGERAYASTGRLEFLDDAVRDIEQSLQLTHPAVGVYAPRIDILGMLLRQRFEDRHDPGDLWKAVSALRTAVARTPQPHPEWTGRAMNLGNALVNLHVLTRTPAPLDEAIDVLERATEHSPEGAPELPQHLSALSRALRVRGLASGSETDLDRSAELDARALDIASPAHPARALLLSNAANGLSLTSSGRDSRWQRAIEYWREACRVALDQRPSLALTAALTWMQRALDHDAAADATQATSLALQALDRLVSAQGTRAEQEEWLRSGARLPSLAARVHVATGNLGAAVLAVERTRASLASRMLARSEVAAELTLGRLQELAHRDAPLVYVVPGEGAMALVVEAETVTHVALPALTDDAVENAVSRLYSAYYRRERDPSAWRGALEHVTRWLWGALMGPVLDALAGHARAHLLPGGLLALLPLHAAWATCPAGRRYAGDELLIALQPNARGILRERAGPRAGVWRMVGVAEPQPTRESRLQWALPEIRAAAAAFDEAEILAHEDATPDRVLAAFAGADIVHCACHGRANITDPLSGGLILAGDRILTLDEVRRSQLAARLVVATACESASVAPGLPDEVVSLAATILQSGADAVLATAFAVDDFTALLVTVRFYAEWRPGVRGTEALREAVRFLRDTTNAEKLAWVGELQRAGVPSDVTAAIESVLAFARPEDRSFSHVVEWAPFTWWGRDVNR